jgi:hypothetical protein
VDPNFADLAWSVERHQSQACDSQVVE